MGFNMFINFDKMENSTKTAAQYIDKRMRAVINKRSVRRQMMEVLRDEVDPYVPYRNSEVKGLDEHLAANVRVTWKGINYLQPYARKQYFREDFYHPIDGPHPLAHHHWVRYGYWAEGNEIRRQWQEIINDNLKG